MSKYIKRIREDGTEEFVLENLEEVLAQTVVQQPAEKPDPEFVKQLMAQQYKHSRASEYPPIGDQLDALFKAGVFPADMAAAIQAVKDKYPKGTV